MAKLIHSIALQTEKSSNTTVSSTRETTGRRYVACLVATTTESSVRIAEAKKAELEQLVATTSAALDAAVAKWGCTVEQAKADHEARSERWYNRVDGYHETASRLRDAVSAKSGGRWMGSMENEAKSDLIARGFANPYDKTGSNYEVVDAAFKADTAKNQLAWHVSHGMWPLGSQSVISWHQSVALANKAIAGCDPIRARGDSVTVRTDIEVRERATRAKKVG